MRRLFRNGEKSLVLPILFLNGSFAIEKLQKENPDSAKYAAEVKEKAMIKQKSLFYKGAFNALRGSYLYSDFSSYRISFLRHVRKNNVRKLLYLPASRAHRKFNRI